MPRRPQDKSTILFAATLRNDLPTLDLHGFFPDEALHKLELFLFENYNLKKEVVKIIYGGGTGVLREKVLTYLHSHPLVDTLSEEGGSSVVLIVSR
jgi:DNA-nicking Smr family endonuclease